MITLGYFSTNSQLSLLF